MIPDNADEARTDYIHELNTLLSSSMESYKDQRIAHKRDGDGDGDGGEMGGT